MLNIKTYLISNTLQKYHIILLQNKINLFIILLGKVISGIVWHATALLPRKNINNSKQSSV